MQPAHQVRDVLQRLGDRVEQIGLNTWQLRTLHALHKCRTAALGGHVDACDDCGNISISYNSCRNRHCPRCQGKHREDWIVAREQELLPVPYFHVVFTLPECLNKLALQYPKECYSLLFDAAWETLACFGTNKGLKMGMIGVLHTWGQNLSLHPHLHCIVPGGGTDGNGRWRNIRTDGKFLFPVKALSKVFRAKYCEKLAQANADCYAALRRDLWEKPWVVYAKRPFGSPKAVVEYLGRYSHKIAISNHRIKSIDEQTVTFTYKDYRQKGAKKTMTLTHQEFIRRFAMHILPKRFVKIRHYGILSSTWKREKLWNLQRSLGGQRTKRAPRIITLPKCPCCKTGTMYTVLRFDERGPPEEYLGARQKILSYES
jgi:hypothetical protein